MEYSWKNSSALWRTARVIIDDEQRLIHFHNCVIPKKFFSLLPSKETECGFDEVERLRKFMQGETRTIELRIPTGRVVFLDDEVPRFDEFCDRLTAIVEASGPQKIVSD